MLDESPRGREHNKRGICGDCGRGAAALPGPCESRVNPASGLGAQKWLHCRVSSLRRLTAGRVSVPREACCEPPAVILEEKERSVGLSGDEMFLGFPGRWADAVCVCAYMRACVRMYVRAFVRGVVWGYVCGCVCDSGVIVLAFT